LTPENVRIETKPAPDITSEQYVAYHQRKGEYRRKEVLKTMSPIRDKVKKISQKFGVLERPGNSQKFDHQMKIFHKINTYVNSSQLASDYLNVHAEAKGLNIHIGTETQPYLHSPPPPNPFPFPLTHSLAAQTPNPKPQTPYPQTLLTPKHSSPPNPIPRPHTKTPQIQQKCSIYEHFLRKPFLKNALNDVPDLLKYKSIVKDRSAD
jgi:hypothetical protein